MQVCHCFSLLWSTAGFCVGPHYGLPCTCYPWVPSLTSIECPVTFMLMTFKSISNCLMTCQLLWITCLTAWKRSEWLSDNSLILNEKKTEIMLFDSHTPYDQLAAGFGPFASFITDSVSNLDVLPDSWFKLEKRVSSVVGSGFFQSRQISKVKRLILRKDLEKIIHAFLTPRLYYCNSLHWTPTHSPPTISTCPECCGSPPNWN